MTVYRIETAFGATLVIATSIGEAEEIFLSHYWPTDIRHIDVFKERVLTEKKPKEV